MEKQENHSNNTPGSGRKMTSKQIVALIGVALLVLLYVVTLVVAIVDTSDSGRWFMFCIFGTVAIPLLIWIYTWMYGKLTGRHTIADAERGLGTDIPADADAALLDSSEKTSSS